MCRRVPPTRMWFETDQNSGLITVIAIVVSRQQLGRQKWQIQTAYGLQQARILKEQ